MMALVDLENRLDKNLIEDRLNSIEAMNNSMITREELREYLNAIYDLERLMTRISLKTANPRDMLSFKNSIKYSKAKRDYKNGIISGDEMLSIIREGYV